MNDIATELRLTKTKKITEAEYAHCQKCDSWYDAWQPVPWRLSNTVAMHKRGCGGPLILYKR